jgi:uncharacterized protein with PIN domain
MKRARFRFYAELNDFLPNDARGSDLTREFELGASVKDMIEAFGVPHTEVEFVLVNGKSVDFSHRVEDGDDISVYPVFESFDISEVVRVRPQPLRESRFVLDAHLGTLARYLRLLGFDCDYRNDFSDRELVDVSVSEGRVLLTRDVGILKRSAVTHGYFVRATEPRAQAIEVLRRFDLFGRVEPFRRCLSCNGRLEQVPKADVEARLPPRTARYYNEFRVCSDCERVYWKGSHYSRMLGFVEEVQTLGAHPAG